MTSWTPENIAAIITAATALVGAIYTLYHSIVTRGKVAAVNTAAAQAKQMSMIALKAVARPAAPPTTVTQESRADESGNAK